MKEGLEQRLQEAQQTIAQHFETISARDQQLADAVTAAQDAKAQSEAALAAEQNELTQANDSIRAYHPSEIEC